MTCDTPDRVQMQFQNQNLSSWSIYLTILEHKVIRYACLTIAHNTEIGVLFYHSYVILPKKQPKLVVICLHTEDFH